ncbi:hypothetical protein F4561_001297 [Lipingzhangella halophila]|uniref:DUF4158 domain-containing protein n=1 Tax=Lipingzhangella halophila TaxID=1783352 RepID=A0A7W7W110_9ACTN|nr:DUF4158 domain-containing protein [Lipingzhangella halophila]MBB4930477.1 hypothetical protein [Lipingzhangella halophila]
MSRSPATPGFPGEVSVADLEQFFRLDSAALEAASAKRTPPTRMGWALQWGMVRMLGVFRFDAPTAAPAGLAACSCNNYCYD